MAARRRRRKNKQVKQGPIGGLAFFLSLFCLLVVAVFNLIHLPLLWFGEAWRNLCQFGAGAVLGGWFASVFIQGHVSVFIHELKHSIISNFARNKAKGFKIKKKSGHFTYSYTRESEKYNALIALAPYWLPLFTFPALILGYVVSMQNPAARYVIVGIGFGIDCLLNWRDISPIQTDLTGITGGYKVGLLFVLAMNTAIITIIAAWVFQDLFGLKLLLRAHWEMMIHIVSYYRGL